MPKRYRSHFRAPKLPKGISVNLPGYTPDWKSLIETDPTFVGYKTEAAGRSVSDKAERNAGLITALTGFGALPDLTGLDLGDFGIDEATRAAILGNTNPETSTTARLARENATNLQNLQDALASRGMLRSGALGVGLGQEQERYEGSQTRERTDLLAALGKLQELFADAEEERYEKLYGPGGAAEATTERLKASGLYKPRKGRTVKAKRDPATGLYVDADGNYYDRNGNKTDPNAGRARRAARRFRRPSVLPGAGYTGGGNFAP